MKKISLLLFIVNFHLSASALHDSITIENKAVSRTFYFSKDSTDFYTTSFINKITRQNYVNPATEEFSISINNVLINGLNSKYISHTFNDSNNTHSLTVILRSPLDSVYIHLVYEVYENIPLVRKQLQVINKSSAEVRLINLDVEQLRFQVIDKFMNEVYTNYGSNLTRIPYKGDYNDAAVMLFNAQARQGAIFGNESPGVLKNTGIYTQVHGRIQMGMRHIDETFPFKKWLQPGETFRSPKTFIYVFTSPKWQDGFENEYKEFVRKYLGVSLFSSKKTPLFLYNTWRPFLDTIDEKLVKDCTDKLAASGADLFIIDAGWYKYSGDFIPDSNKFPSGMKSVCDYIRSKGLQVGLWFTVSGVNAKSNIAMQHPEWLIKDKDGKSANLHDMSIYKDGTGWGNALKNMSLGSPYYDHIKKVISNYITELGITYVKLDLSLICSAYLHEPERSGDYETNASKLYRDRASSYWVSYERIMQLMDELHAAFPGILIDCTYEVWGRYNIADYALIEHADFDWLTNIDLETPAGSLAIRQMNYDRSRAMPTGTLLIGNASLNFLNYKYVYFSLASSTPVMVGDPRKLAVEQQKFYYKWNNYLRQMEAKYQYSRYFQLYDVFDRPSDNNWDGCYRINTEKQGGLLFFYRNNSPDAQRTFRIPCLESEKRYKIYSFEQNQMTGIYSGKLLIEEGLTIKIPSTYTAIVLSIEKE